MPQESVGDALRRVHGWLRPRGRLVNIQPTGRPVTVDLCSDGEQTPVGEVHVTDAATDDVRSAQAALANLVRGGLMVAGESVFRELEFHYHTVEDWEDFLQRPKTGRVEAQPDHLRKALSLVAEGRAILVGTEATVFSVFSLRGR